MKKYKERENAELICQFDYMGVRCSTRQSGPESHVQTRRSSSGNYRLLAITRNGGSRNCARGMEDRTHLTHHRLQA